MRRLAWLGLALFATSSCHQGSGSDGPSKGASSSDSAGVHVAEAAAPESGSPPPKRECSADGWCEIMRVKKGNLFGIWGIDPHNLYAIWGGVLVQERELEWHVVPTGGQRVYAVRGTGPQDIWAVGDQSTIWHLTDRWQHYKMDKGKDLRGLALSSADSIWAVGDGGTIIHYDGKEWKPTPSGTTQDLIAVWADPSGDAWTVGTNGTALHWVKGAWVPYSMPTKAPLAGLWGSGPSDIWAVGGVGSLLHYNGKTWTGGVPVTNKDLFSIWGTSDKDVWAVGAQGTIIHWDGNLWGNSPSGKDYDLHGVWGLDGQDMWVVGVSHSTGETATLRRRTR